MWVSKFYPWVYEISLFSSGVLDLKDYDEELYKVYQLLEQHGSQIESMMETKMKQKSWDARLIEWAKWYWLLLRFKVLYLKSNYNMTYRETEENLKQNLAFRLFLWISDTKQKVPSYVIIKGWHDEFWEQLMQEVNEQILLKELKKKKIIRWNKSRWDTTVVEENVAYPTDSTLLKKWKDLLIKGFEKIDTLLWEWKNYIEKGIKNGVRKLRTGYFEIKKYTKRRNDEWKELLKKSYEKILDIMENTVKKWETTVVKIKRETKRKKQEVKEKINQELKNIEKRIGQVKKVIEQTKQRVIEWKTVEMGKKIISYFSDEATIIKKWKEWKTIEIGRKLSLVEVENWVIWYYKILDWNPNDVTILRQEIEWVEKALWKKVKNHARDRWYYNQMEKKVLEEEKNRKLHIPKRWKKNQEDKEIEKKALFKKHQRFRAGWEWKISTMKRRYWLGKLRVRGDNSVKNSIWWAVVSENIRILVKYGY